MDTTDNKPTPIVIKCEPTEYCCCVRIDNNNNNNTYTHTRALATNSDNTSSILSNVLRLNK